MPLPDVKLDDLRFQRDLVDEARLRIQRYCPEWTDYNLSDPGITLIELFAWMTELMVFRLNRVPEKNYIKFLELLGIKLMPPESARAELTFRLSGPFPLNPDDPDEEIEALIPAGTEVATRGSEDLPEVVFTTNETLYIRPPELIQLRRDSGEDDFNKNYLPDLKRGLDPFYAFNRSQPRIDDAFYLGFNPQHDIRGYILRFNFQTEDTEGVGIRRNRPPWEWSCALGNGEWQPLPLSDRREEQDTTGGLNNAQGSLVLYLPLDFKPDFVHDQYAYWIRCRIAPDPDHADNMYRRSPRLTSMTAQTLGAATVATHAVVVENEVLGKSDGNPNQLFSLQYHPVLPLQMGETVEVEESRGSGTYQPWQLTESFAASSAHEPAFMLDHASGEIAFAPQVRQPDGTVKQYGRIPPLGATIRFKAYRHGGGTIGNVPTGRIQVLRSAISYVDSVRNLKDAAGGRDQETLEEAKLRAQREIRSQERAVTAEDYETLSKKANPALQARSDTAQAIARVRCLGPEMVNGNLPPGLVELLVVPDAVEAIKAGAGPQALTLDEGLRNGLIAHLDKYRLLTTTLNVREPDYIGIEVTAQVVCQADSRQELVRAQVKAALDTMICPIRLTGLDTTIREILPDGWEGWPFGQHLYLAEVYSWIQQVPGVKHVIEVTLKEQTGALTADPAATEAAQLSAITGRQRVVPADALLYSLDHKIEVIEL